MKNIIIRTLGGGSTGYGHFFRCLSLAKAIRKIRKDIKIVFLLNDLLIDLIKVEGFNYLVSNSLNYDEKIISNLDTDIDLFVLDTYLGSDNYLKMVKNKIKTKIMLIDDNNDIYDSTVVDIIYNGNIHAEKLNYTYVKNQLRLLGSEYLIMKEEYRDSGESDIKDKNSILITTGGSDEYGIALNIMYSIRNLDARIRLIIGPGYKKSYIEKIESEDVELIYKPSSLKTYINRSEIVITAGGSTVYEILSQNSIPIVFSLADNQDLICKELRDRGVYYLGKYPNLNYSEARDIIRNIKSEETNYEKIFNLVNPRGVRKVSKLIMEYIENKNIV